MSDAAYDVTNLQLCLIQPTGLRRSLSRNRSQHLHLGSRRRPWHRSAERNAVAAFRTARSACWPSYPHPDHSNVPERSQRDLEPLLYPVYGYFHISLDANEPTIVGKARGPELPICVACGKDARHEVTLHPFEERSGGVITKGWRCVA
jgi:hypothetical protein